MAGMLVIASTSRDWNRNHSVGGCSQQTYWIPTTMDTDRKMWCNSIIFYLNITALSWPTALDIDKYSVCPKRNPSYESWPQKTCKYSLNVATTLSGCCNRSGSLILKFLDPYYKERRKQRCFESSAFAPKQWKSPDGACKRQSLAIQHTTCSSPP